MNRTSYAELLQRLMGISRKLEALPAECFAKTYQARSELLGLIEDVTADFHVQPEVKQHRDS